MLTAITFIIILALLVFVHELGHFLVAKKNGVRVEEFGLGFPPRIWGVKRGETIYSINLIPLGGFVKIFGEDGEDKNNKHSFASKKIWQRAIILLAGVAMNILLAFGLLSFGYWLGLPQSVPDEQAVAVAKVQIVEVVAGSPADKVGIKTGDVVKNMRAPSGELSNISRVAEVQNFTDQNKEQEILVTLQRGRDIFSVKLVPRANPPAGEGAMGVALARVADVAYPWYQAIYEGGKTTAMFLWLIISSLGYLIWELIGHGRVIGEVAGPVGIFSLTGQAAQMGFAYLLQLTALLSINLAIINAFPFPALDGGRVLFLIIEKIKGSPVSQTVEKAVHTAGFVFLILLMLLITVRDVMKII